jgi:hypothetical protein
MDEHVINIGAIRKSRQIASQRQARLITFPDGLIRHISLPGWLWAAFDRIKMRTYHTQVDEIDFVFASAEELHGTFDGKSFEDTVRYLLAFSLGEEIAVAREEPSRRRANDL